MSLKTTCAYISETDRPKLATQQVSLSLTIVGAQLCEVDKLLVARFARRTTYRGVIKMGIRSRPCWWKLVLWSRRILLTQLMCIHYCAYHVFISFENQQFVFVFLVGLLIFGADQAVHKFSIEFARVRNQFVKMTIICLLTICEKNLYRHWAFDVSMYQCSILLHTLDSSQPEEWISDQRTWTKPIDNVSTI